MESLFDATDVACWRRAQVHSKGLKFGMYTNYGHSTCMGFPGTEDKDMERDARRFASWGVDYLKVDGCHSNATLQRQGGRPPHSPLV